MNFDESGCPPLLLSTPGFSSVDMFIYKPQEEDLQPFMDSRVMPDEQRAAYLASLSDRGEAFQGVPVSEVSSSIFRVPSSFFLCAGFFFWVGAHHSAWGADPQGAEPLRARVRFARHRGLHHQGAVVPRSFGQGPVVCSPRFPVSLFLSPCPLF